MRVFKPFFMVLAGLWIIALLLVAVDLLGATLGAPPPGQAVSASTAGAGEAQGQTPGAGPTPTPNRYPRSPYLNQNPKGATGQAANASSSGTAEGGSSGSTRGGLLYPLTAKIPAQVARIYGITHWFYYPLPLLLTIWLLLHISKLRKAQARRCNELAQNWQTLFIGPQVNDKTKWEETTPLITDLYGMVGYLPQNQPKARYSGQGVHLALGYVSRRGDGIRLTATFPAPSDNETGAAENETVEKAKAKNQPAPIPEGLAADFINQVKSYYPWSQPLMQDSDPLDLEAFAQTNAMYRQYRQSTGQAVTGWQLLGLAQPSHLPVKTDFSGDPTRVLYQKLDLGQDSDLLACGIELVLVPASDWRNDANTALKNLHAQEIGHNQASKQALSPAQGKGGSGLAGLGINLPGLGGAKGANVGSAASSRVNLKSAQQQREAIEDKLEDSAAFSVMVYVWAEGSERAVQQKVKQLAGALVERYRAENSFRVVASGQDLRAVRKRGYSPFFAPEPSVLSASELAALWHLPSPQEITSGSLNWAKAVSPPPESDIVHAIILKDGTRRRVDNTWRQVLCLYAMPDGSKLEIGIGEQGLLRGQTRIGRPGSGKTVTAESSFVQDIERDDKANSGKGGSPLRSNGIFVSDPNRDMSFDLLDRVPDWYERHVCFVDATDKERVCSLNPLYIPEGFDRTALSEFRQTLGGNLPKEEQSNLLHLLDNADEAGDDAAVAALCSAVLDALSATLGVSMDNTPNIYRFFANSLQLVTELDKSATFWTIKKLLEDGAYREAMVESSRNNLIRPYWEVDFPMQAEKQGGAALTSTKNRMEALLRDPVVRRLFAQRKRTVNIRELLDAGETIIGCFSPELGANKGFIMQIYFKLGQLAVFSRADTAKEQRRTTSFHLDEFQESVAKDPETVVRCFEQIRKYGGALNCMHQNLEQVKNIVRSIVGNVGTMVAMNIGPYDRTFYSDYFSSRTWPKEQIEQAFAELPRFSMIPRIFDNGKEHTPFVAQNLPRSPRLPNVEPLLIAVNDSESPNGYHLEFYDEALHAGLLEVSEQEGFEGFWVATAEGQRRGVQPSLPKECPGLIEALTRFLYQADGMRWQIVPFDPKEAAIQGLTAEKVAEINRDPAQLAECWELLLSIEALPPRQRLAYLTSQQQLSDYDWLLYRASRYGRDLLLWEYLIENPGLIPVKRERILTLSRLKYGVPVAEIEAETVRPDQFTARAGEIKQLHDDEAQAEMTEAMLNSPKGKGGGKARKALSA
ncbi:MAG TPA: hypothetical protein VH186_15695 [Chloroflexia bacterium]|nr:hypothetical protein [Chloroflexia bacterium]